MKSLLTISAIANVLMLMALVTKPPTMHPPQKVERTLEAVMFEASLEQCRTDRQEILNQWEADLTRFNQHLAQAAVRAELPSFQQQRLQREMTKFLANQNRSDFRVRIGLDPY